MSGKLVLPMIVVASLLFFACAKAPDKSKLNAFVAEPGGPPKLVWVTRSRVESSSDVKAVNSIQQIRGGAADGVVLDVDLLRDASPEETTMLKEMVGHGAAVVAIGESVSPDEVGRRLGLETKQNYSSQSDLVAEGILHLGNGVYHTMHVVAPSYSDLAKQELLQTIGDMIRHASSREFQTQFLHGEGP